MHTTKQELILNLIKLQFYSLLSGSSWKTSEDVVSTLMEKFQISQYKNVKSGHLSGGNQRKVCTAISLIGMPQVSFSLILNFVVKLCIIHWF